MILTTTYVVKWVLNDLTLESKPVQGIKLSTFKKLENLYLEYREMIEGETSFEVTHYLLEFINPHNLFVVREGFYIFNHEVMQFINISNELQFVNQNLAYCNLGVSVDLINGKMNFIEGHYYKVKTSYVDLLKGKTIPVMVLSHLDNDVGVSVPLAMFSEEKIFKISESYIVNLSSKNYKQHDEFTEEENVIHLPKPSIV
ncbi:hypothetical protein [Bacillus cereus]|uniref:Uncharacterized protein n=1 Tax=Bacillus cereus TaxID=1396 RepID=A0AA44Q5Y1_BACCE|nr:hypothetical protein [Bacillus cereus]PFN06834.1 hypothetical protein COJ55_12995 [Bacillus cereus]PFR89105.1 hypothetical protein COK38_24970 [Bacillus cereus]